MSLEDQKKHEDFNHKMDKNFTYPDTDTKLFCEKYRQKYHMMGFEEFENTVPRYKSVNLSVKYLNGSIIDAKYDILSGNRKTNKK